MKKCPLQLPILIICEEYDLGLLAPIDGTYAFQIFMNGRYFQYQYDYLQFEVFKFPPFLFNPNSTILLQITKPDGEMYEAMLPNFSILDGVTDFIIKTAVVRLLPLVDPTPLP